jgi:2-polyprenyl-6-methoxyphenol hydroxylase-like FAD-dependent oxidoreductase
MKTAILGGGVAGLALARALHRRGAPVTLFERATHSERRGFGFLLQGNGLQALRDIGLAVDPLSLGCALRRTLITTTTGRVLADEPLQEVLAIDRGRLLEALGEGLPATCLVSGKDFAGFDWQSRSEEVIPEIACAARFADGSRALADVFVGADGAASPCRQAVAPGAVWSAGRVKEIVCAARLPELAAELAGTFLKFVHPLGGLAAGVVPVGGDNIVWFVQFDTQRYPRPAADEVLPFLVAVLADFPETVREVVLSTAGPKPHVWDTVDMEPLPRIVRGNVALAGDASHVFLPFTSQGANSALVDAHHLAECIVASPGPSAILAALAAYEASRLPVKQRYLAAGRALARGFVEPVADNAFEIPLVL